MLHVPKSGSLAKVLLVTDGLEEGLTGTLVYCVKADASKDIKMRIIGEVCYSIYQSLSCLDGGGGEGTLGRCEAFEFVFWIF